MPSPQLLAGTWEAVLNSSLSWTPWVTLGKSLRCVYSYMHRKSWASEPRPKPTSADAFPQVQCATDRAACILAPPFKEKWHPSLAPPTPSLLSCACWL